MGETLMTNARSVLVTNPDWQTAVNEALEGLASFGSVDLLVVFASAAYQDNYKELAAELYRRSGAGVMVGCSGQGIIGLEKEIEKEAALSVLALSLPGADLHPVQLTKGVFEAAAGSNLPAQLGLVGVAVNAWLLLVDPFTIESEQMIDSFSAAYPAAPIIGGMASASPRMRRTYLFLNGEVLTGGAVALAVGGKYTLHPVVSQGATPIGEAWMVTEVDRNIVRQISGRPAYEVLLETIKALPPDLLEKARRNLMVGLAVDEYRSEFGRGDFIIRSLMAADQRTGLIALNDFPRLGQTIQFQLRDAEGADEELRLLLAGAKTGLGENAPLAGVLFACNGRGSNMFEAPDHDAKEIAEQMGPLPLAGFFCNGEIGPVGPKTFLHGFTASLGLFVEK